jgi:hypothetical protein
MTVDELIKYLEEKSKSGLGNSDIVSVTSVAIMDDHEPFYHIGKEPIENIFIDNKNKQIMFCTKEVAEKLLILIVKHGVTNEL